MLARALGVVLFNCIRDDCAYSKMSLEHFGFSSVTVSLGEGVQTKCVDDLILCLVATSSYLHFSSFHTQSTLLQFPGMHLGSLNLQALRATCPSPTLQFTHSM